MLKKSKILSVICFFVCVLLILTSCNSSKKPTSGETGTENTTENTSAVSDTAGATETEAYPDVVINREFEQIEDGKLNIVIGGGASQLPAKPGDEVSVKIELKNNNVISSLKMILSYDPKLSVVTDVNAKGEYIPAVSIDIADPNDSSVMQTAFYNEEDDTLLINWVAADGEVSGDTLYATVLFKVAENAAAGDFLFINAQINPNDVFDYDLQNIEYKLINGGVDVIE